jgi:hypothetical protein
MKHLRHTSSGAAGNDFGTSIKYLRRITSGAAGTGLGRFRGLMINPSPQAPCIRLVLCVPYSPTLLCEVIVRFVFLLSPMYRTQGPVRGGKVGQVT